jgi:hypothetical protein
MAMLEISLSLLLAGATARVSLDLLDSIPGHSEATLGELEVHLFEVPTPGVCLESL